MDEFKIRLRKEEVIKPNFFIGELQKKRLNKKIITFAIIGIIGIVLIVLIILSVAYFGSDKDVPTNESVIFWF